MEDGDAQKEKESEEGCEDEEDDEQQEGDDEEVEKPQVGEEFEDMAAVKIQPRVSRPYGFTRDQQSREGV